MFFPLLIVIAALCNLLRIVLKNRSTREPPELSGKLPIIGHGNKLMAKDGVQLLQAIIHCGEEAKQCFKGAATFYLFFRKLYILTEPEDIMTVMSKCLGKQLFADVSHLFVGNGLLIADVPTWKKHRKLLNPAFSQHVIDGFVDVFNARAVELLDQFAKEVGKPFDQDHLLRENNLGTICMNLFGVEAHDPEFNEIFKIYLSLLTQIQNSLIARMQKWWLHSDFIYNLSSLKRSLQKDIDKIAVLSKTIIEKKKKERQMFSESQDQPVNHKSFIDLLLDLTDEGLSEEQIHWETETIIVAGHETMSSTLTFTMAVLGSHPKVQHKVYKEIVEVLGNANEYVTKEDLRKLTYLEAIIKEAARLYVVSTFLPRTIETDIQLKNYTLKAGAEVIPYLYFLHRHPIWGPDADQFRPERWFEKENLPDAKFYGSFGLGRRNCIGKTYAMMSMKVLLTHLIRKYHISADASKIVMKMHMLVSPHTGHEITLAFRKPEDNAACELSENL